MTPTFFATPAELRKWFERHHASEKELLVGYYKVGSGKPSITWPESVDEALCFGWIDGVRRSLGEEAYCIRFTPRKTTSIWSKINVDRVKALKKEGRMTAAGLKAFAARKDGTDGYSFERIKEAALSAADERKLRANKKAAAYFDAQAPWYRRTALHWVTSAKKEETRARRLEQLIAACAEGRPVPPLRHKS